jgi:predicted transcriptional regulator
MKKRHASNLYAAALGTLTLASLLCAGASLRAMAVGQVVENAEVRDASDRPASIPHLGKKTVLIFYVDPDVPYQNDPFAEALKKHRFPQDKFFGMGIVNLRDAPLLPNSIVRAMVRREIRANNAVILTDPDRILQGAWDLGDCNNKSVIILVDPQRRVRFFKKGALTEGEIQSTIQTIIGLTGR